jgi:hypothetical protein
MYREELLAALSPTTVYPTLAAVAAIVDALGFDVISHRLTFISTVEIVVETPGTTYTLELVEQPAGGWAVVTLSS